MPKRNDLNTGEVVIVQDEVPRNEWPLGMVMETSMNQEALNSCSKSQARIQKPTEGKRF